MSASSRFGYSMFTGAVLSGALVGYEATKRQKHMAAAAVSAHAPEGHMLLASFIGIALAVGVVIFAVATVSSAMRRRPAPVRRSYGGNR